MCVCLDSNQNEDKIKQFYELLSLQIFSLWFAGLEILHSISLSCEYGLLSQAIFYHRIYITLITRWQQNFHSRLKETYKFENKIIVIIARKKQSR